MDTLTIEQAQGSQTIKQTIAIAATFTAEPIEEALSFWMQELNLPYNIEFSPYNQVFQQLLTPNSLFAQNQQGINLVLVRFEDWQRYGDTKASLTTETKAEVEKNLQDLIGALKSVATRSAIPHIVCICPSSPVVMADADHVEFWQKLEELCLSELSAVGGLYIINSSDIAVYSVDDYYDPQGDKLGHIPYTPAFFAALGTAIARKIYALKSSPYKVIALDCDNTLWKGIVGEDGVTGIEIDSGWKALQELIVKQYEAGMLICLCSKNNEADVIEVFEKRSEMPLKREHIVSWRINWMPKSENIKSLAAELNLGLDSFIFIDDNPVECAEVQASCPSVLALQLPIEGDITRFLNHVWALDRLKITEEDKQRTALYKQNVERDRFAKEALTIEGFLAGLNLKVDILEMQPSHLARVSQLTQRTNQFNFTTIRRSEAEVQQLCQSGKFECRIVEVSDRFGDYGLVGVIIWENAVDGIKIDTFLLSCRVLGRGVEHRMLTHVAEVAKERQLNQITATYISTQKNQPALNFLNTVGSDYKQTQENGYIFQFPVEFAAALSYTPTTTEAPTTESISKPNTIIKADATQTDKSTLISRIANELYSADQILQLIESQQRQPTQIQGSIVQPQTETEEKLAKIWAKLLRVEQVGINNDFFEMGGNSVLGVSLFAQIETVFGKNLPLATLLQAPTIKKLANLIDEKEEVATWSPLVALQPKGNKPPLFCPHAAGGNVLIYRNLAPYLGEDQPLYGLQPKGLDGKDAPLTKFEDIADYYIEAMRSHQPQGPYYLAGLSSGGKIAMAIAQKLIEQGEKIAFLGMFDTYGPGYPKLMPATSLPRYLINRCIQIFDNHWNNLKLLEPKQKVEYIQEKLKIIPQESMKIVREFYWRTGRKLPPALQKVQEANRKATKAYAPRQVYPGKVTLFRASKQPIGATPDPELGWSKLVAGGIEIHDVTGYHGAVITEPHVRIMGAKLKACLDKVQEDIQQI